MTSPTPRSKQEAESSIIVVLDVSKKAIYYILKRSPRYMNCQSCGLKIHRDDPILAICEDCFRYEGAI